jgi:hypothetical protein
LWRWLSSDALRPWKHRSWIFPRDPDFASKAGPILDLYQRVWGGAPLGAITPWNWPINQVVIKAFPAFATGCTVVHKPSEVARMDSNHDKVIQSHLVHDGRAIVATFSGFRAASLPVCLTGPSSSQLIEEKQLNFVLGM